MFNIINSITKSTMKFRWASLHLPSTVHTIHTGIMSQLLWVNSPFLLDSIEKRDRERETFKSSRPVWHALKWHNFSYSITPAKMEILSATPWPLIWYGLIPHNGGGNSPLSPIGTHRSLSYALSCTSPNSESTCSRRKWFILSAYGLPSTYAIVTWCKLEP